MLLRLRCEHGQRLREVLQHGGEVACWLLRPECRARCRCHGLLDRPCLVRRLSCQLGCGLVCQLGRWLGCGLGCELNRRLDRGLSCLLGCRLSCGLGRGLGWRLGRRLGRWLGCGLSRELGLLLLPLLPR